MNGDNYNRDDRGYDRGGRDNYGPPPRDNRGPEGRPPPPPQDYGGPPPQQRGPPGPPRPAAPKGAGATLGMIIMIIAIIGLIMFYVLPWFSYTSEVETSDGKKTYTGSYDQDLKWKDGDREIKESYPQGRV